MLRNWWFEYGEEASLGNEVRFEFDFEGTTIVGVIDRIGPMPAGRHADHRLQDGNADNAPKAEESLQLGIYYLAVKESDDLAAYRPVRQVELAYVKGDWKGDHRLVKPTWRIDADDEERYQASVRESLAGLIAAEAGVERHRGLPAEPDRELLLVRLQVALPVVPRGAARLRRGGGAMSTAVWRRRRSPPRWAPSPPTSSGRRSRGRSSPAC